MGKGSTRRPTDQKAFNEGFDRIFGKKESKKLWQDAWVKSYEVEKANEIPYAALTPEALGNHFADDHFEYTPNPKPVAEGEDTSKT